jgi:hypothetical protein
MEKCEICGDGVTASIHLGKRFCSQVCKRIAAKRRARRVRGASVREVRSLAERIDALSIPEPNSGCFLWLGNLTTRDYGQIRVERHWRKAHRVAYELAKGGIPEGAYICHRCDVQICVNPDHLYAGTAKTNFEDMRARGRWNASGLSVGDATRRSSPHR